MRVAAGRRFEPTALGLALVQGYLKKHPTGLKEVCECGARLKGTVPECIDHKDTFEIVKGISDFCGELPWQCPNFLEDQADMLAVLETAKACLPPLGVTDALEPLCRADGDNACVRAWASATLPSKPADNLLHALLKCTTADDATVLKDFVDVAVGEGRRAHVHRATVVSERAVLV